MENVKMVTFSNCPCTWPAPVQPLTATDEGTKEFCDGCPVLQITASQWSMTVNK